MWRASKLKTFRWSFGCAFATKGFVNSFPNSKCEAADDEARGRPLIVGLGAASLDYVATVAKFPCRDDKIRSTSFNIYGGGNCGNTLTALSRLQLADTSIMTKLGTDSNGKMIANELKLSGINVDSIIASPTAATLLVYVIVDEETATRTCIANPSVEELTPTEVIEAVNGPAKLLDGASIVHLDTRQTVGAVALAKEANARGITVTVDVEKDRPPHLAPLLPLCDVIFTNERFPQQYFKPKDAADDVTITEVLKGADGGGDDGIKRDLKSVIMAMSEFFYLTAPDKCSKCAPTPGRARVVVTTLGSDGALLLRRRSPEAHESSVKAVDVCPVDRSLLKQAPLFIRYYEFRRPAANGEIEVFDVIRCSAWPLNQRDIVDSTGAGDAFIGGFLGGMVWRFTDEECLKLGTSIAAHKLGSRGARLGLPSVEQLHERLTSNCNTAA